MFNLRHALLCLLLIASLLSCGGPSTVPTEIPTPEPTATSTPVPTATPTPTPTPVPSPTPLPLSYVLGQAMRALSNAPGLHFTISNTMDSGQGDSALSIKTDTEGDGRPGGDFSQKTTMAATFGGPAMNFSVTMDVLAVAGKTYVMTPVLKGWQASGQNMYEDDHPVVKMLNGALSLESPAMTKGIADGREVYRITGKPGRTPEYLSFELIIDAQDYWVRQLEFEAKMPGSAKSPPQGFPFQLPEQYREKWQLEPLKERVTVSVPTDIAPAIPWAAPKPAATPSPPPGDVIWGPYGRMLIYRGKRVPVAVQYQGSWSPRDGVPAIFPTFSRHSEDGGAQLTITEPSFAELGLPDLSLDSYVQTVISTSMKEVPDFALVQQLALVLRDNQKAQLVAFTGEGGQTMYYRLIYVYENRLTFNLTYSFRPSVRDITDLVKYSVGTLAYTGVQAR